MKKLAVLFACSFILACSDNKFDLPQTTQSFPSNYSYNNKVDILWMIDNSSSMAKHQNDLSAQVPALMDKLNSLKMDFHMAVVTSSMGGTNPNGGKFLGDPKFLTATTPQLANQLTSRLIPGEDGSDNERGLESVETVLSSSYQSNEGKGFLRDDALLVIIALSDEDDKSKNASTAIQYYTNLFDGIKKPWTDGSRSWMLNFIGVLSLSSQCKTYNDYAEPGATFLGLAAISKGTTESICTSDFLSAVSNIRARIYQIMTDFKLKSIPNVDTIVVTNGGVVVPRSQANGWDYIEATNSIRFYGTAVPAADASINVDFKPKDAN